jgi:hypothetical protein
MQRQMQLDPANAFFRIGFVSEWQFHTHLVCFVVVYGLLNQAAKTSLWHVFS